MPLLVIDADYLVYSAGFATEKVEYFVSCITAKGVRHEDYVDSKEAATAWRLGRNWPLGTRFAPPVRLVEEEPVSHAKLILRNILKKIYKRAEAHFGGGYETQMFITGDGNFRYDIATIKPYKGNRINAHKPVHYKELREYLEHLGAFKTYGMEADDAVSICAASRNYDESILIAAVDKDLWTVPGMHYNFQKDEWSDVSLAAARLNFYRQIITGDVTDNIGGCFRAGKKAASQLEEHHTEQELYSKCLREYERSLGRAGCPYGHMSGEEALLENARLLHMLRAPGELWAPPAQRPEADSSGPSCATSTSAASTTSTSRKRSKSKSKSPGSSAKPAGRRSSAKRAILPISGCPESSTTSSAKGS